MTKIKPQVFPSDELCMYGKDLRQLRIEARLSERELADKMGWYRKKVQRLEGKNEFCLHKSEMHQLLDVLEQKTSGASEIKDS